MKRGFFTGLPKETINDIIENLPAGIYINELNGTFLYGNKKAEKIVGYNREELIGKKFTKTVLLDFNGIRKALKLLALNRIGKETGPDEFELRRKDGGKSIVIIRTTPVSIGDRKVVIGMVEDITDRKRLENELKERNEALEDFQKMAVGRELKMVELKKEIDQLKERLKTIGKK
jgi:PAS domain S-box-containing protein